MYPVHRSFVNNKTDNGENNQFYFALSIMLLYIPVFVFAYFIYDLFSLYFEGNDIFELYKAKSIFLKMFIMYMSGCVVTWLVLAHVEFAKTARYLLLCSVLLFQIEAITSIIIVAFG